MAEQLFSSRAAQSNYVGADAVPGVSEPLSGLFSGLSHAGETDRLEVYIASVVPKAPASADLKTVLGRISVV